MFASKLTSKHMFGNKRTAHACLQIEITTCLQTNEHPKHLCQYASRETFYRTARIAYRRFLYNCDFLMTIKLALIFCTCMTFWDLQPSHADRRHATASALKPFGITAIGLANLHSILCGDGNATLLLVVHTQRRLCVPQLLHQRLQNQQLIVAIFLHLW